MKKKSIILGIILIIIVIISIFLLTRPKSLGNINFSCTEKTTKTSEITFSGDAGHKLKFSFRSNIERGNLSIILYDSEGNAVYELDKAKSLETFFELDKSDTYVLVAECDNFIGNFKVKVTQKD